MHFYAPVQVLAYWLVSLQRYRLLQRQYIGPEHSWTRFLCKKMETLKSCISSMDLYTHSDLLIGSGFMHLHQHKLINLTKWKICLLLQKWFKTKTLSSSTCGTCRKFCWGPAFWLCELFLTGQALAFPRRKAAVLINIRWLFATACIILPSQLYHPADNFPPPNPLKCIPLPCNPALWPVLSFQHKYAMGIFKSKALEDRYQLKTEGPLGVASQNTKTCEHALATAATPTLFPEFLNRGKKKKANSNAIKLLVSTHYVCGMAGQPGKLLLLSITAALFSTR